MHWNDPRFDMEDVRRFNERLDREEERPPREGRGRALRVLAAVTVAFMLWQVAALDVFLYPFRLFVTLAHELGHGVAAVITGGQFVSLQVMPNGAGLAATAGGSRFVIIQAGYLGAALLGGALLVLANWLRNPRLLMALIGVVFGGVALLMGRDLGTRVIGLATVGVFAVLARWGAVWLNSFAINLLAMMVALNAVMDIWGLLGSLEVTVSGTPNDALAMQALTGIPAVFWGLLWIVVSLLWLGCCAYFAFFRRGRKAQRTIADDYGPAD